MRVKRVMIDGFMGHVRTDVELPACGVVLVTGENGAGKSALIEAVSCALWGKTLRGSKPWTAKNGAVHVLAGDVEVRRTAKASKNLEWLLVGEAPVEYDSTRMAQAALEAQVGEWNIWKQTCVFQSRGAAAVFTSATDGERKLLLEKLLGLERFDIAYRNALREQSATERNLNAARREVELIGARRESTAEHIASLEQQLAEAAPAVDVSKVDARLKKLEASITKMATRATEIDAVRADDQRVQRQLEVAKLEAQRAQARVDRDACGACGQAIPEELRAAHRAEVSERHAALQAHRPKYTPEQAAEHEELAELSMEAARQAADLRVERRVAERAEEQRKLIADQLAEVVAGAATLDEQVAEWTTRAAAEEKTLNEQTAVCAVLSLAGVRAHLLGQVLKALETTANSWLARIVGEGVWLELSAYSERADGKGVKDAISMQVHGYGGTEGYRACSAGQQRRIDVAMLFALADLARNAHDGDAASTLFCDEVFDALDRGGAAVVCDVLREMGETRCCVVVSHNEELAAALRPDVRMHVDAGTVTVT